MENSRSHIVVLSQASVTRAWPMFELKRAYLEHVNKNKDFVVIKFGEIAQTDLPGLAQHILDSKIYLNWPEAPPGQVSKATKQKQELFWAKLASKLYNVKSRFISVRAETIDNYLDDTTELLPTGS